MELLRERILPSAHTWFDNPTYKQLRFTVKLSVYKRDAETFELRIEHSITSMPDHLQRFRAGTVAELLPLGIKTCSVPKNQFRDFIFDLEDVLQGIVPLPHSYEYLTGMANGSYEVPKEIEG